MNSERIIKKILRKTTKNKPLSLRIIIGGVDMLDRSIISHIELNEGLIALNNKKLLGFIPPNKFYDLRTDSNETKVDSFLGITEEDYSKALQEYNDHMNKVFSENNNDDDEDFFIPRITIYWRIVDNSSGITEDEEEKIDDFTNLLVQLLTNYQEFELIGFEKGGDYQRILIYGENESDQDTDLLYVEIRDIYTSFKCPSGSYIIRYYWDSGEKKEVKSDYLS